MDELDDGVLNAISHHVAQSLNNSYIDSMIESIQKAGLTKQFEAFIEDDKNKFINADDYFIEFAKLYPEKFYIVPEGKRYSKTFAVKFD